MTSESLIEKIADLKAVEETETDQAYNEGVDDCLRLVQLHWQAYVPTASDTASPDVVERTAALKSSDIKATENGESVGYMESDRMAALPEQPAIAAMAESQSNEPDSPSTVVSSGISLDEKLTILIAQSLKISLDQARITSEEGGMYRYDAKQIMKVIRPYLRTTGLDYRAMYENLLTEYHKVVTAKGEPVSVEERSDSHRKGYQHGYEDGASMAQELSKAIMAAHAKWQASYQGMGHE